MYASAWRNRCLLLLSAVLAFCIQPIVARQAESAEVERAPNIVFIFTDDQAPWALEAAGHPHARTPNMDRLMKEGAYLVNSFTVTPVCSPSRASLMTSRYGTELGITDWINPGKEPNLGLDPKTITWPEVLQKNGYKTGLVGKWHLGVPDQFHPTRTGFDYFMGFLEGGTTPDNPTLERDGEKQKFKGFTPDILTDHALAFVEKNQQGPFLLCLHFRAPHARWLPVAEEDWQPFASLDPRIPNPLYPQLDVPRVKRMTREYLASVHSVDRNVGRLLGKLDELKLSDDTVVIYSSDHGYNMGHNGIWHKGNGHWVLTDPPPSTENIPKGQRPNMYDHSIRVPTMVRWPGRIKPGAVVEHTVSNLDWYPTILAVAGVDLPAGETIRGRSIVPLLDGEEVEWNDDFYAQYSTHHQSHTHMRMIRSGGWKLIRDFLNPERDELYDLTDDPEEAKNLIHSDTPEVQQVTAALHEKLLAHMRETDDPVLSDPKARLQTFAAGK
ncbi:MAG: sulfatase-like hydrolase/transferase [Pirellulaceae bacterium]